MFPGIAKTVSVQAAIINVVQRKGVSVQVLVLAR